MLQTPKKIRIFSKKHIRSFLLVKSFDFFLQTHKLKCKTSPPLSLWRHCHLVPQVKSCSWAGGVKKLKQHWAPASQEVSGPSAPAAPSSISRITVRRSQVPAAAAPTITPRCIIDHVHNPYFREDSSTSHSGFRPVCSRTSHWLNVQFLSWLLQWHVLIKS